MQPHRTSLFITLLSALLFNVAWLGFYTGWLVIVSFFLLIVPARSRLVGLALGRLGINPIGQEKAGHFFLHGFVWGLIVFTFHFHWLAQAIVKHGECSWLLTVALVLLVIGYFSVCTGGWFSLLAHTKPWSAWLQLPVTGLFWYLVDGYGLMPLGMGAGYPFINPCLPLTQYQWFLVSLSMLFPPATVQNDTTLLVTRLCFVQPVANRAWCYGEAWTRSPHAVVSRIQKKMSTAQIDDILVSPESMLLFPLNQYTELVETLSPTKNSKQTFIVGALRRQGKAFEQVAYCLRKGLIIKTYVKKNLVPFAEQIPPAWQMLQGLRQRLMPGFAECISTKHMFDDDCFYLAGCCVRPVLCWEFFEQPVYALSDPSIDAIIALVNDSWYSSLFRQWLFLLAMLKSHICGRLVVYIGHYGCYTIEPKNHSITQVRSCYASLHA